MFCEESDGNGVQCRYRCWVVPVIYPWQASTMTMMGRRHGYMMWYGASSGTTFGNLTRPILKAPVPPGLVHDSSSKNPSHYSLLSLVVYHSLVALNFISVNTLSYARYPVPTPYCALLPSCHALLALLIIARCVLGFQKVTTNLGVIDCLRITVVVWVQCKENRDISILPLIARLVRESCLWTEGDPSDPPELLVVK
jgi:hypothetical protein